jgi:hypothetical protein
VEILILILLIVTLLIRVLIGARLFVSAKLNNLPNLRWLAWYFCANAFIVLFSPHPYNPIGNLSFSLAFFVLPLLLTQISLIFFNQDTFYKDKQSPARWFWMAFIITSMGTIYGVVVSPSNSEQSPWVATYIISQFLIWSWHAQVAHQAWFDLSREPSVQDWVKTRYLLIVAYSIAFLIGSLGTSVRIIFTGGAGNNPVGITSSAVTLIAQFISVVLQYLVWVMPEPFRAWLNRDYQSHLDEYSEHQSKAILQMIGASISRDADINQFSSLRAVRHVIGKMINTENSETIEKHIGRMGYKEWVNVLQDPEMIKQITLVSNRKNVDSVLENAAKILIEKQSLFTIESK